jgi:hypothetical protein
VPGVEQVIEMPAAPMQPGRLVRGAGDVAGALRSESRRLGRLIITRAALSCAVAADAKGITHAR